MAVDTRSVAGPTVAEWLRAATADLEAAGFSPEEARGDAGVLARHTLGWDLGRWLTSRHESMPHETAAPLDALIRRRGRREPVAYLTGVREFYGREFLVSPAVLVPRPETELLIDAVGDRLRRAPAPNSVLDVGTGSGCIAITLALEHPGLSVTATDVSGAALTVARENARRLGAPQVAFVEAALTADCGPVNLVVSNPPYVAAADRDRLQIDVRDFEPPTALFGGDDGLAVITALVPAAWRSLAPGGWLVMEIGSTQGDAVRALCLDTGFRDVAVQADLAGLARVVVAQRPAASV